MGRRSRHDEQGSEQPERSAEGNVADIDITIAKQPAENKMRNLRDELVCRTFRRCQMIKSHYCLRRLPSLDILQASVI